MISQKNTTPNDTLKDPQSPTPNWRPPRAPLPPHRLAKLANALGVSTPVPAGASFLRSVSESLSPVDPFRRSPTPSTLASTPYASGPSTTSKFLLHVLPPLSFPCESDCSDEDLIRPTTASGYHTQFRRGILVPVYSNFQTLLCAIAKEYALPSTAGLILYLITNSPSSRSSALSPASTAPVDVQEEPGPRLSDEIWRHIWSRVIQAEQGDDLNPQNPGLIRLKTGMASRSTPQLLDTTPLRSLLPSSSIPDILSSNTTSPSTPSTSSDPPSHSKSVAGSSIDDLETPDTSAPPNAFDLPGLRSPSLIPILAKVEFDIDRRKAVWYEPWLRNRTKRIGRKGSATEEGEGRERHPPIQLIIGRQQTASPLLISTPHPSEENDDNSGESDRVVDDEATIRVGASNSDIPLVNAFGKYMGRYSQPMLSNPDVVGLAFTAADLEIFLGDGQQGPKLHVQPEGEDPEWMSRPGSSSTAKGTPISPSSKRSSTSTQSARKHVPPPLLLASKGQGNDLVVPSESSPMGGSPGSANLAYLGDGSSPGKSPRYAHGEVYSDHYPPVRSSTESEKRVGIIYDDLDLGLDPTDDFDEDDPNDRRRSQFLLKAQLDEIERTMAQLSPRMLNPDLSTDSLVLPSFSSKPPSSFPQSPKPGMLNVDYYPPSPLLRPPSDFERNSSLNHSSPVQGPPRSSSANATANSSQVAWPTLPYSSIRDDPSQAVGNSSRIDDPPSPPRLALNGITTSAPKSFVPALTNVISAETEKRKRELEEEYPALAKSASSGSVHTAESPVIPLSPDPFGRYPSSQTNTSIEARLSSISINQWDAVTVGRGSLEPVTEDETPGAPASEGRSRSATVSRFSADSVTIGETSTASVKSSTRSGLMNVKSIRRLWRKSNSNKSTVSTPDTNSPPAPNSGQNSPQGPPMRPERPSQETMDLPDVEHPLPNPPPNFKGYSPQPSPSHTLPPGRMSQDQHRPSRTSQDQCNPSRASHDQMGTLNAHVPNVPQSKHGLNVTNTSKQGAFPSVNGSLPNQTPGLIVPPQTHPGSLGVPHFIGRNGSASPIIAAQMLPRAGSSMSRLHFDQESPYPVHVPSSPRYSPRAISPPALPPAQSSHPPPSPILPVPSTLPLPQQVQSLPPLIPEREKHTARKSILKAFQKSKTSPVPPPTSTEPRSSIDKQSHASNVTGRPRRPSFHSTKSSLTSVNDIPPSPHIPEQYLQGTGSKNGTTLTLGFAGNDGARQPKLTASDSAISQSQQHLGRSGSPPPLSMVSSRSSQETRPSIDASQFEIVSPGAATST